MEGSELLSNRELAFEAVMLGLRTSDGIDFEDVRARCGIDLAGSNRETIERFCDSGHLALEGSALRPTLAGMAIADTLARSFEIPDFGSD